MLLVSIGIAVSWLTPGSQDSGDFFVLAYVLPGILIDVIILGLAAYLLKKFARS
jgi:hypothetical protein